MDLIRRFTLALKPKTSSTTKGRNTVKSFQPYRPLDPAIKEIRVLILEPGSSDDRIKCRLKHVSLMRTKWPFELRYETISYVWGDGAKLASIVTDGVPMKVPQSSYEVLRRMRLLHRSRVLWLDAVCINQDDVEERSSQVTIMGEIYSGCTQNLIWLGEDRAGTGQAALEGIEVAFEEMRLETNDFQNGYKLMHDEHGLGVRSTAGTQLLKLQRQPLIHFYSSAWFTRVWVVQEAALPPRNLCHYGELEIDFVHVLRAAAWITRKALLLGPELVNVIWNADAMFEIADHSIGSYAVNNRDIDLCKLLNDLETSHAREPRDHVFGILGLALKYSILKEIPPALLPDYHAPVGTVLRDATMCCILQSQQLRCLEAVYHYEDQSELYDVPTWVPRWDKGPDTKLRPIPLHSPLYHAGSNAPMDVSILLSKDLDKLPLRGISVEKIKDRSSIWTINPHDGGFRASDGPTQG